MSCNSKYIRSYDKCECGRPKQRASKRCNECRLEARQRSYDLCSCGKLKDRRAFQCRACKDAEPKEKKCRGCNRVLPIDSYSYGRDVISSCCG